jgi:hypothetical protein
MMGWVLFAVGTIAIVAAALWIDYRRLCRRAEYLDSLTGHERIAYQERSRRRR